MAERQNQKNAPYIEIYHQTREAVEERLNNLSRNPTSTWSKFARNIADLGLDNVHFEPRICAPLPDIPRDTPVVLGGVFRELCVKYRELDYREAGFTNVRIDDDLSVPLRG